jgi:hypothetical protein
MRRVATILVDELHAGGFQGAANSQVIGRRHGRLIFGELGPTDRGDAERGLPSESSALQRRRARAALICALQIVEREEMAVIGRDHELSFFARERPHGCCVGINQGLEQFHDGGAVAEVAGDRLIRGDKRLPRTFAVFA